MLGSGFGFHYIFHRVSGLGLGSGFIPGPEPETRFFSGTHVWSQHIHGYVQELTICLELHVNLHPESQIKACHILHMDTPGSLCKINKTDKSYNQILNYFFVMKDTRDLTFRSFLIMEIISSRHNTFAITKMLSIF